MKYIISHKDGTQALESLMSNGSGALAFKNVKITRFANQIVDAFKGQEKMTVGEIVYENEYRR